MIYFLCAMSAEAAPFLRTFDLEKRRMPYRYEVYESRAGAQVKARLTVSGIGSFHAACASAFLLGLYPPGPDDLLVNVGICGTSPSLSGAERGTIYQCGKILSPDGSDSVYPAVRRDLPWEVATLQTSEQVVTANEITNASGFLYDMEGYAFAKAASGFSGPDRMAVVKVVYDRLKEIRRPKPQEVYDLLKPVAEVLRDLEKHAEEALQERETSFSGRLMQRAREIASDARVSVSMRDRIFSRATYVLALFGAYRPSEGDAQWADAVEEAFSEAESAIEAGQFVKSEQNRLLEKLDVVAGSFYGNSVFLKTEGSYGSPISVLYVEEEVMDHPRTLKIREHFPKADVIPIRRYRDIFNRSRQELPGSPREGAARALIVARQENIHIYPGAPMCQDHGHRKFFYASFVMNCLFDCEYCYLQGMYPSKMPVIFVNPEDVLEKIAAIEETLKAEETAYVSVSFDTDLCAFEGLLGIVDPIARFAMEHPRIEIEIRTKSAGHTWPVVDRIRSGNDPSEENSAPANLRFAWSFSPAEVISRFEHKTASLEARLEGMTRAIRAGFKVRLCFDPLLQIPDAKQRYEELVDRVMQAAQEAAESIGRTLTVCVDDVSMGPFRIGSDQLSNMRRIRPDSPLVMYPYEIEEHTARYPKAIENDLIEAVRKRIATYVPEDRIFCWDRPETTRKKEDQADRPKE